MGTRADFYVGKGDAAEWLGSIAYDGYPDGIPRRIRQARSEEVFREEIGVFLASTGNATVPEQGWPWPWETSHTTDFAYVFDDGRVQAARFGKGWFDPNLEPPEHELPKVAFKDMTATRKVAFGERSGVLLLRPR